MRKSNTRSAIAIVAVIAIYVLLIGLAVVGFIWQRGFMPHVGAGSMEWWQGFVQGAYVLPNFIVNLFHPDKTLDIYQSGAGGWYQFWFLFASGAMIGGSATASK
jgi:hypothetical protein